VWGSGLVVQGGVLASFDGVRIWCGKWFVGTVGEGWGVVGLVRGSVECGRVCENRTGVEVGGGCRVGWVRSGILAESTLSGHHSVKKIMCA
jgi:hypothetical protein